MRKQVAKKWNTGFTLVELMVSISIFVFMTILLVAKYGAFNQSVLLTNLAYDVALTIRTAQVYGLSVRQAGGNFDTGYGVFFSQSDTSSIVFFADTNSDGIYDAPGERLSTYTLKRGAHLYAICMDVGCTPATNETELHITFKRPDPNAHICVPATCGISSPNYVKIIIAGPGDALIDRRAIEVYENGQVAVGN